MKDYKLYEDFQYSLNSEPIPEYKFNFVKKRYERSKDQNIYTESLQIAFLRYMYKKISDQNKQRKDNMSNEKVEMNEIYIVFRQSPNGSCSSSGFYAVFDKQEVAGILNRTNDASAYKVFTFPDLKEVTKADVKLSLKSKD